MNVLVTGGAGYIGSHTCVELLNAGHALVIVDNFVNSKPEALDAIRTITGKDFAFCEADLRDRAAMDKIFTDHAVDAVIHFAGLKAVGESVEKPLEYYDNNLYGFLVLAEVMRAHGVKMLVFSSSATVYGMNNPVPFNETMPT
ncbi:MAG: SDR family NAD(P)-dependent oxidoreductase, partial [Clostridia bacterium]|nr:SDR family NAD(P)-dependent oxidoreductase [Clostridia bacterium]